MPIVPVVPASFTVLEAYKLDLINKELSLVSANCVCFSLQACAPIDLLPITPSISAAKTGPPASVENVINPLSTTKTRPRAGSVYAEISILSET